MTTITLGGLNEEDFRRSIQNRLREGKAYSAIKRLRVLLTPYAGPGGILPQRFLSVEPADLTISGWATLGDAMARHDRPGRPITAMMVAFGWSGEDVPQPDAQGHLHPHIETSYFNDDSFPFSQSRREDLLDGYSFDGCIWNGDAQANDNALGLDGIDDLVGALASLEAHLLDSDEPDEAGLCAGSLGACLLSALLVQAVTERIERDGLPRALCVTAGSNSVYPYIDAPVAGLSDEAAKAASGAEDMVVIGQEVPVPRYSSLLLTGIPRAKKRAVLVLEESEDEIAVRIAGLRQLNHPEPAVVAAVPEEALPAPAFEESVRAVEPQPEPQLEPELESMALTSDGGLLLAKKPARHSADFRDMLSPREGDLQQRLQCLIATHAPAPNHAPLVELQLTDEQSDPVKEPAAIADVAAEPPQTEPLDDWDAPQPPASLGARLLAKVRSWRDAIIF